MVTIINPFLPFLNTGDHPRTTSSKNRRGGWTEGDDDDRCEGGGGWKADEYLYKFNRNLSPLCEHVKYDS